MKPKRRRSGGLAARPRGRVATRAYWAVWRGRRLMAGLKQSRHWSQSSQASRGASGIVRRGLGAGVEGEAPRLFDARLALRRRRVPAAGAHDLARLPAAGRGSRASARGSCAGPRRPSRSPADRGTPRCFRGPSSTSSSGSRSGSCCPPRASESRLAPGGACTPQARPWGITSTSSPKAGEAGVELGGGGGVLAAVRRQLARRHVAGAVGHASSSPRRATGTRRRRRGRRGRGAPPRARAPSPAPARWCRRGARVIGRAATSPSPRPRKITLRWP